MSTPFEPSRVFGNITFFVSSMLGMIVGITVATIMFLSLHFEQFFNSYHEHAQQLYRIRMVSDAFSIDVTPAPLANAIQGDIADVLHATRLLRGGSDVLVGYGEQRNYEDGFYFSDSSFFDVFSISLLQGDPETLLSTPESVVLTRDAVRKYFGATDPMGKTITVQSAKHYTVTGVCENVPKNTHFQFDFLASLITVKPEPEQNWTNMDCQTYVVLSENLPSEQLEGKLADLFRKKTDPRLWTGLLAQIRFVLQPLAEIRRDTVKKPGFTLFDETDTRIALFSIVAVLALLLTAIHWIHLVTARLITKTRTTTGGKITMGQLWQMVKRCWLETLILSLGASLVAAFLVMEWDSDLAELIGLDIVASTSLILSAAGLAWLGVVALSFLGSFPGFLAFAYHIPAVILKCMLNTFQFGLFIFLFVCSITVYNQLYYLQQKDPGFNVERTGAILLKGDRDVYLDELMSALETSPQIESLSLSEFLPFVGPYSSTSIRHGFSDQSFTASLLPVSPAFFDMFELQLLAGRGFSEQFSTDAQETFVINERTARILGLDSPVGASISLFDRNRRVIGVVRDFHYQPLYETIQPAVFVKHTGPFRYLLVKTRGDDPEEVVRILEERWQQLVPDWPLKYIKLEDKLSELYPSEDYLFRICVFSLGYGTLLVVLSLYATVSYLFGYYGPNKLLKAFLISLALLGLLPLLASLGFGPGTYLALNNWLEYYPYRVGLEALPLVSGIIFLFVLTLLYVALVAGYFLLRKRLPG